MKNQITDVYCYYTGGGIYTYSARYGDAWLYGRLDEYIECFKVRGEVLFHDEVVCEGYGWLDEMNAFTLEGNEYDYYISPEDIQYPTWKDILDSLKEAYTARGVSDMEACLIGWNPDLTKHTNEDQFEEE